MREGSAQKSHVMNGNGLYWKPVTRRVQGDTTRSLFSHRTGSGTERWAARVQHHLGRAPYTLLKWPTKSCLVYERQFRGKRTISWLDSPHLIKESKNRAAPWADLQAAFLAVMEELSNVKSTCFGFFLLTHRQWKTGLLKGCLIRKAQSYGNHSGNLQGTVK